MVHSNQISIALAQIPVIDGDVSGNLTQHISAIGLASNKGADLVVFPELSLTGYALDIADKLAVDKTHSVVKELSEQVVAKQIIAIVGCPAINPQGKPYIAAGIFYPTGEVEFYHKQFLHQGEQEYVSAGVSPYYLRVNGYKIAVAVCADFTVSEHAKDAQEAEADLYLVSGLISPNGYQMDSDVLAAIASDYQMPVFLSNHVSHTGGWETAGNSAVWDSLGEKTVSADGKQIELVVCRIESNVIESETFSLEDES